MLTAQVEPFPAFLEEAKPLFPLHWAELALHQEKVPLDPDYDEYLRRDAAGGVVLVTVREDGKLCGYFVGFVAPALHYKSCLSLTLDIFWIHPEHRGAGAGFHLFKTVEKEAKRRGIHYMVVGSKLHKDASWLFEKLGYAEIERYFSVWLGE